MAQRESARIARDLESKNPDVRLKAMDDLMEHVFRHGQPDNFRNAVPSIVTALDSDDPRQLVAACRVLSELGQASKKAISSLCRCLSHMDASVRSNACLALGRLRAEPGTAVPALRKSLVDKNFEVRMDAATAIGCFGIEGKDAAPEITRLVAQSDDDPDYQLRLVETLGLLGEYGLKGLTEVLDHKSMYVKCAALEGIGEHGKKAKDAVPVVKGLLEHKQGSVRLHAAKALSRIDDSSVETAVSVLCSCLSDPDAGVRGHAAHLIAQHSGGRVAVPALIRLAINDPDVQVRTYAVTALGRVGGGVESAKAALSDALNDPHQEVRAAAKDALKEIARMPRK